MRNFNKIFTCKIISAIVVITFAVTNICYGVEPSNRTYLRIPLLGNTQEKDRPDALLHEVENALDNELSFVSKVEISAPMISLKRAWDHSFGNWRGDRVFEIPLTTSDHVVLAFLSTGPFLAGVLLIKLISLFNVMPLTALAWISTMAFGIPIVNFLGADHVREMQDAWEVYRHTKRCIKNPENIKLDNKLLKIVRKFEKETGWEIVWTDSSYILTQPQLERKRVIVNIGWVVADERRNSWTMVDDYQRVDRRPAYLTTVLRIIRHAIKDAGQAESVAQTPRVLDSEQANQSSEIVQSTEAKETALVLQAINQETLESI